MKGRGKRLEKKLSLPLPGGAGAGEARLQELAAHWDGFEWVAGPWVCTWRSDAVGTIEVWAVSEAEGQGVIEHALAFIGADWESGEFSAAICKNPRFGRVATMRPRYVSARTTSSGVIPIIDLWEPPIST